jgi:creatinine amidohydrolase
MEASLGKKAGTMQFRIRLNPANPCQILRKEAITMQWENLAAPDFAAAVKETQEVCLLPLPCIEKHGGHLPLGTDLFIGMEIARRAAEIEPAIVFPPFYLTQILEAKHQPGAIAIGGHLMLQLLEAVCDEIGRNGLSKIILVVSHGGNRFLAPFFVQTLLETRKDYMVYMAQSLWDPGLADLEHELMESEFDHHGGEMETSVILAIHPELVKMDRVDESSGQRLDRLQHRRAYCRGKRPRSVGTPTSPITTRATRARPRRRRGSAFSSTLPSAWWRR